MNMFRAFMELDEAYNERQSLIDTIKKSGKNYNFDKYTDAQLYRMVQRLQQPVVATKEPKHELDLNFEPEREHDCCDFCGMRLTDLGQCPACDLGEEDLAEGIFDSKHSNRSSWVSMTGRLTNTASNMSPTTQSGQTITASSTTPGKYVVRIVYHGGRLRALATDGTNPAAWVAFPNDLRQFEGQQYEVDQLIWNGKNYRVAGNIVEI